MREESKIDSGCRLVTGDEHCTDGQLIGIQFYQFIGQQFPVFSAISRHQQDITGMFHCQRHSKGPGRIGFCAYENLRGFPLVR